MRMSGIFLALLYYVTFTDTFLIPVSLFNHILHKGTCCHFVYLLVCDRCLVCICQTSEWMVCHNRSVSFSRPAPSPIILDLMREESLAYVLLCRRASTPLTLHDEGPVSHAKSCHLFTPLQSLALSTALDCAVPRSSSSARLLSSLGCSFILHDDFNRYTDDAADTFSPWFFDFLDFTDLHLHST